MDFNDFLNSLYSSQKTRGKRPKNGLTVMKKTRFATQDKTKTCSFCKMPAEIVLDLGNDTRKLCKKHHADYKRRDFKYSVKFEKASDLLGE